MSSPVKSRLAFFSLRCRDAFDWQALDEAVHPGALEHVPQADE